MDFDKIRTGFTYVALNGPLSPHTKVEQIPPTRPPPEPPKDRLSKTNARWERIRAARAARRAEREEINDAIEEAMLDSGATSHFFQNGKGMKLTGPSSKPIRAANGGIMRATNTAEFPLPALKPSAKQGFIVPQMTTKALLSVGKFSDAGYTTIFHPHDEGVTVHDNDSFELTIKSPPLLQGWRRAGGLWTVPLVDQAKVSQELDVEQANNVYELPSTSEVVRFLHAALGFPTKATLLAAARKGNLVTFPGMTVENISRFFPESDETQKGHMRQTRQGVRSTKIQDADEEGAGVSTIKPGVKKKDVYVRVFEATKRSMYTDQTGRFPITSARGHKYLMVAVELDGNYIDAEPIKTRKAESLTNAYKAIKGRWDATGVLAPNWHMLDNEAPEELKTAIRESGCTVELTPADMHRRNVAEKAIQTFKSHFIATLAGVSDTFPIHQWDELIPQVVLTLNLLRQSNVAPNISAYSYHHGPFDYNRMPIAPMGCAVQFHIKPGRRKSFGEHSADGWYLRTSPEHYRCHVVFVKATRAKRITDTVFFKHKYITQPTVTPADAIVRAYHNLIAAINGIKNTKSDAHLEALEKIHTDLAPGNQRQIEAVGSRRPRVERHSDAMENDTAQAPRVLFREELVQPDPKRMIVASPTEPLVESSSTPSTSPTQPNSILKKPTVAASNSIAERVKARHHNKSPEPPTQPELSIAERVAARRRAKEQANPVLDHDTGEMLEYRQLLRHPKFKAAWNRAAANEFGRLAQGIGGRIEGTNTIEFIHKHEVPQNRFKDVTYIRFVSNVRTEKEEQNRVRATMGGNLVHYPDDVGTPTADLLLIKIFLNSVISTPGARFANADISNFYLLTPLTRPEYAKVRLSDIPDEVIEEYNLREKATPDGWVYLKVTKGMYGLPQAGSLGHDLLESRLNKEGYYKSKIVPGLWKHKSRPLQFVLVVDDFGIKYIRDEDLDHLVKTLEKYYDVKVDKDGKEYVKIELDWDYANGKVHLSMKPYLDKALRQFDNVTPTMRHNSPYPHVEPKYGAKQQYAAYDESPPASKEDQKYVQKVNGKFLWYGRSVDGTMLTPLSALASQQTKPTTETMKRVKQFLDYAATQEPAVLTYRKSGMVLAIHSDASYLNEENARSRAGGHHFLSEDVPFPPNNGAVHNVAEIIKAVMSSAAEAELGSLYINAKKGVEERHILTEMGHPQPPTPIQVDNSTAEAIVNNRVQPKRTKAMDMRFHWLRDRQTQKQFRIYWRPGAQNLGDYWTKHHPPSHHRNMRPEFLTPFKVLMDLRKTSKVARSA